MQHAITAGPPVGVTVPQATGVVVAPVVRGDHRPGHPAAQGLGSFAGCVGHGSLLRVRVVDAAAGNRGRRTEVVRD